MPRRLKSPRHRVHGVDRLASRSSRSHSPSPPVWSPSPCGSSANGAARSSSSSSASRDRPTPTGVRETVMRPRRLRTDVIRTWRGKAEWAVPLLLFLAILLVAALAFNVANLDTGGEAIPGGGASGAARGSGWPVAAGAPLGLFLGLTVLVTIVILVVLLRRGAGVVEIEAEPPGDDPAARHAAADAVQDAIEGLEVGGDVRSVILACFRRFCALLGARGITAQGALTPRELEGLAVERLHVSRVASETLTSLFEEARYSEHPLGEADRHRAIESLAGIRAALGA